VPPTAFGIGRTARPAVQFAAWEETIRGNQHQVRQVEFLLQREHLFTLKDLF